MSIDLSGKSGAIFAASGAIAGAVARHLAECGAAVHLSARDGAVVQRLARVISGACGTR
jgi:NADP-dependent 3-hydroxy acid dehydrogenase YdfG